MTWTLQQATEDLRKRLDELALSLSRDENELKPILTEIVWVLEELVKGSGIETMKAEAKHD